jgi:hypothetical protein
MSSIKDLKAAQKSAAEQWQMILELKTLVADIERCEKTISAVNGELTRVNAKYQGQRNTRQDIEYLSVLLDCARRKLAWEKQISSVQKRTPALLEQMQRHMNDEKNPPTDEARLQMLQMLQSLQSAMERLQSSKVE